jgi:hypothetical protein
LTSAWMPKHIPRRVYFLRINTSIQSDHQLFCGPRQGVFPLRSINLHSLLSFLLTRFDCRCRWTISVSPLVLSTVRPTRPSTTGVNLASNRRRVTFLIPLSGASVHCIDVRLHDCCLEAHHLRIRVFLFLLQEYRL